jgi:hypothetical protein
LHAGPRCARAGIDAGRSEWRRLSEVDQVDWSADRDLERRADLVVAPRLERGADEHGDVDVAARPNLVASRGAEEVGTPHVGAPAEDFRGSRCGRRRHRRPL